jgi:putative ABC transport system substrate-binding protein
MQFAQLQRRAFITLLGSATAAWPHGALAQQVAKVARIGFPGPTTPSGVEGRLDRFRAGLRDLGYVEGQNIFIDFRWAEGNYARLTAFAAELIGLKVDVLVTHGTPATLAVKQATATLPIVTLATGDAVATGIVASLAHPGGNVTGSTSFDAEINAKRLEVLKDACPLAGRIAILLNPGNQLNPMTIQAMRLAAEALKLELHPIEVRGLDELQSVVSRMNTSRVDAVAATQDSLFTSNAGRIAEITTSNRLPLFGYPEFARAGGLFGWGDNIPDQFYRGAYFVDKILKGAKPADLPVERPTKFDLVINLKTARALGLEISPTLLARADEVIE